MTDRVTVSVRGRGDAWYRSIHAFDRTEPREGGDFIILRSKCERDVTLVTDNPRYVTCRFCRKVLEKKP